MIKFSLFILFELQNCWIQPSIELVFNFQWQIKSSVELHFRPI